MYSPLWKITHQKSSVSCTPPFENHPLKAIGFVYSPLWKMTIFGRRLFRVGAYFGVDVFFGKNDIYETVKRDHQRILISIFRLFHYFLSFKRIVFRLFGGHANSLLSSAFHDRSTLAFKCSWKILKNSSGIIFLWEKFGERHSNHFIKFLKGKPWVNVWLVGVFVYLAKQSCLHFPLLH